jgi:hypothetical protein
MELKLTLTDNPKRKGYVDRYTVAICSDGKETEDSVMVKYHPRFQDLQNLHLMLTKILMND